MPDSPASPAPRRPVARRRFNHASSEAGPGSLDIIAIVAGVALCAAVGYVGYRTQVRGEKIEQVLPFLAADRSSDKLGKPSHNTVDDIPETHPDDVRRTRPGDTGDKAADDPDNTYFGRREKRTLPNQPR